MNIFAQIIQNNIDIVYFVYGMAFIVMGLAVYFQTNKASELRIAGIIWLVSIFGIVHGIMEWVNMWSIIKDVNVNILNLTTLVLSFIFLFEFGRRLLLISIQNHPLSRFFKKYVFNRLLLPTLCAAVLIAGFVSTDSTKTGIIMARYLLGFPACLLTGIALLLYYKRDAVLLLKSRIYFKVAGITFIFYGILAGLVVNAAPFFPSNIINENTFNATFQLPVQLFRAICAAVITFALSMILNIFNAERVIEKQLILGNARKANKELHRLNRELQEKQAMLEDSNVKLRRILMERTALEHALRDSEYFFKESQRAAFIGSYRVDFVSGFWNSSDVLDSIFGIDKDYEKSIQGWFDIIHPDDRNAMNKYLQEILMSQHKIFDKEYQIIRIADKQPRWIHGLGELAADKNGNIVSMIGTIQDITERKATEDALARHIRALTAANDNLKAFSHAMAHDLRNPITVIKGFSDTINRLYSRDMDKKAGELLTRISGSALKMNEIIDGLLLLYNISRESMILEDIDINAVANTIINELRESQPDRTVTFITRGSIKVHGQSKLITIMLSNLIRNAWKFTSKTDSPCIELFECSDKSICLKDNGVGFDMARADEIFIPFKRLHDELDFEGSGLGLAIVHQVIDRHNGKIWARGEPGKGAEIYFTLG